MIARVGFDRESVFFDEWFETLRFAYILYRRSTLLVNALLSSLPLSVFIEFNPVFLSPSL